jgi:hypothetical protein
MYISVYNLWIINLALPLFTEDSLKCLYQARRVSGHVYVLGLKCLYQARRVSGHVYVLGGYQFLPLSMIFPLDIRFALVYGV